MRYSTLLLAGGAFAALGTSPAFAQDSTPSQTPETPVEEMVEDPLQNAIVVTARKREETLLDVPIAATALSGELLEARGINSVREAAVLAPGLNINSDGTGRAFVAIRGVGVTLVQSVQPGVGLFIDGIYQPNTAYLNNPLVDVERIEVLRGPQGTLYGKNTLGGAINVISRLPSNELQIRGGASYAEPDNAWHVFGSVSGPIVEDVLQVRVAGAHREQDGFQRNIVLGVDGSPLNTDTINATIRLRPGGDVTFTLNGYYDWVNGVNIPYARVTGPRNYTRNIQFNALNQIRYKYRGINARLEIPLEGINSELALIGAYDLRDGRSPDSDGDFGPANLVRSNGGDRLRTKTAELRLDTELSDTLSSLVGLYYSGESTSAFDVSTIFSAYTGLPFNVVRTTQNQTEADTYAVFGTLFWKPTRDWEVALGLRFDHEERRATGSVVTVLGPLGPSGGAIAPAQIEADQFAPRLTVTRHWNEVLMSYASVSRGFRGGGFNAPTAPFRSYKGDSAWSYEVGTKYAALDRRLIVSGALFYNDYRDYIGLNSIAPAQGGGLVTVDLNSGDVESYGAELEVIGKPTPEWTITGGFTLMRARLTDTTPYTLITKRTLSSDRLTFQPDWSFSLYSDYAVPIGKDSLTFTAGIVGKGDRLAGTLNQTTPTFLDEYFLVNTAITYRTGPVELSVFANNLFNEDYFESYIEKTTLALANLPQSDLGIMGEGRRVGVRASFRF